MTAVKLKYFNGETAHSPRLWTRVRPWGGPMPLRSGDFWPSEREAKALDAGGPHDSQEWIPPVKTRIVYPGQRNGVPHAYRPGCEVKLNLHPGLTVPIAPKCENRQTKIPLESDWSPFESQRCWPVCRHTGGRQPGSIPCGNVGDSERDQDLDGLNDRDYVDPGAEWDWIPEGREELPDSDSWYDVPEIPRGFVTNFDHRKRLKDYRTDEQGRWYHKRAEPYRTWDTSSRKVRDENVWAEAEDDGNVWLDEDSTPGKARGPLYDGKRAAAGERNTMPAGSWGVFPQWEWSQKRLYCVIDGAELPAHRTKYCSDDCATSGSNAVRRNNRARKKARKWPVDEHGWYLQSPQRREPQPNVHLHWEHEAEVEHTVSERYRLRWPWAGEPKVWRIVAKPAELAEDARRIPCRFALSPVIVHLPGNQQRQDWKVREIAA